MILFGIVNTQLPDSFQLSIEMIPDSIAPAQTPDAGPAPVDCAREARREAFVAAARLAFFAHGYGGTAMSAIAAAVGGSKTTLWSYFPSKQDLFAAVVDDFVERYGQEMATPIDPAMPLADALREFGARLMGIVLTPDILDLHRMVVGEAGRFPELGALFFERGPKRGKDLLAAYLTHAMADGHVRPGNADHATRQFVYMCQSGCHQRALLGLAPRPTADEIAQDIEAAVDTFVRAWGA